MANKKNWIYLKRGLSEDPKHRQAMGNRIWLFMHIIDRADWETGIVNGWVDREEAEDMRMSWRTLQDQRQELEELGYITCVQKFQCQDIIIHNWVSPKDYGGKVINVRGNVTAADFHGTESPVPNGTEHGTGHGTESSVLNGTGHGTGHPIRKFRTPSIPSIDHGSMDEWMDGDLICGFLKGLPGYNSESLKADRAAIAPHAQAYDAEALQYLWEDCEAEADNPIGLFLYRSSRGMQSPRFVELCARRRDEAQRSKTPRRAKASVPVPRASDDVQPIDSPTSESPPIVDPSVTQPLNGSTGMTPLQVWQAAQGELRLQMTKATYDAWVKQTAILSVNGTWKIGVPAQYVKEWWETRLLTTVKRVLHGIVGQPCEPEFVVVARGNP